MLPLAAVISDELTLTLQDELFQWNRVIEEMLFLLIVIIGTICKKKKKLEEVWLDTGAYISG